MEEFNNFKRKMIKKLINEILFNQQLLINNNPQENSYNIFLNKIIILKKELDILQKLTYEEYKENSIGYQSFINKYGFISKLNEEQLKELKYIINLNNKTKEFNIKQEINIPHSLQKLKDNFVLNNINPNEITDINELNYMLKKTKEDYYLFKEKSTKSLKILDSLNSTQISILRNNYLYNEIPRKNNLECFRIFGEDVIVDLIENELKNLKIEENKIFKTENVKHNIKIIKLKIKDYIKYLLNNIYQYISFMLGDSKELFDLDEKEILSIRSITNKISNKIKELDNDYKKLIKIISDKKINKETFIKFTEKNTNITIDRLNTFSLGYNFNYNDLNNINENNINDIIAKNNLYDKIVNKSFENNINLK